MYNYSAVRSQAQNFIPYIGSLVAGYDTQSTSVTFTFDPRGVLASTTSSETGIGTGQTSPPAAAPRRNHTNTRANRRYCAEPRFSQQRQAAPAYSNAMPIRFSFRHDMRHGRCT